MLTLLPLILLSLHSQQAAALPAIGTISNETTIPSHPNQPLSSPVHTTNATSTALTLWPPLPYTIPLYAGGIGTLTFTSTRNTPGSAAQLGTAQRIATWLSHLLITWSDDLAIHFLGLYIPAAQGADADAVQVNFVYTPSSPATQSADTALGNVVREFFDAEEGFGCRALGAQYAITEPASVQGSGTLELLLGWRGPPETELLPQEVGTASGRPVIFPIESGVMAKGVMEVVTVGARFPTPMVRTRAYYLMTVMINSLEGEYPHAMLTRYSRFDSQSGIKVSYESERLVAVPRLDGEELSAALRTYRDLVVKRLGGRSIRFNVWKGSSVYGSLAIEKDTEAGNGRVLDGTLVNGTFVETNPILQLGNGTESDGAQLTRT